MRQIADLHIHSKYSRACSKDLNLENIDRVCRLKGVDIIATGDFTYPEWFSDIEEQLEEIGNSGMYKLKKANDTKLRFLLATELALIYKKGNKARRIHMVLHAPNLQAVKELNMYLDKKYNIRSDGRPILGMSIEELMKICFVIHPQFLIYPAHIWTPWFAIFGSKSGFDSLEEAFGKYTDQIYAFETGLSSDPEMNWRLSALDKLTLLSNSDAHSLPNIAREATVFDFDDVSYQEIYDTIKEKNTKKIKYTIEFYPEEGMYHFDGHRACGIRMSPKETKKQKGICPVCKKPLVVGVMYRVDELADREMGFMPKGAPKFKKLVELDKIIANALGIKSRTSKRVQSEYYNILNQGFTEMNVLLDLDLEEIKQLTSPIIAEGIRRVKAGELRIEGGFDGQYGVVSIFSEEERAENKQQSLF